MTSSAPSRLTPRRIAADTNAWEPLLIELVEKKAEQRQLEERIKELTEQLRGELVDRGGDQAKDGLALIDDENTALKAKLRDNPELDLVSINSVLQGNCRMVTEGHVAFLRAVGVRSFEVSGRVDIRVVVD